MNIKQITIYQYLNTKTDILSYMTKQADKQDDKHLWKH